MDLQTRHGAHHHDNLKYGYLLFCISVVYALLVALLEYFHLRRWSVSERHSSSSMWQSLRPQEKWWLHILVWLILVIVTAFFGLHDPIEHYLTIAKRLGRLAYSIIPLDMLLVLRPSLITHSYLELVTLHKWFLRLIIAAVLFHGAGFCLKWAMEGTFWSKASKLDNLLGEACLLAALVLSIISVRAIRQKIYRVFYVWHNVVVLLFLVPMYWHARPGVADFILVLVVMLGFQIYQRLSNVYGISNISIIELALSSLQVLKIQKPVNYPTEWVAGSHIRLSYPMTNYKYWLFPSHPYTIFSQRDDRAIELVVQKTSNFQVHSSLPYSISGPSVGLPIPFYETAKKVVILCGGSGISLGAPLFRELLTRAQSTCKLVWCVSNKSDTFVLNELRISEIVDVYITRTTPATDENSSSQLEDQSDSLLDYNEGVELRPLNMALDNIPQNDEQDPFSKDSKQIRYGRPDLNEIFSDLASPGANGNNWVVVCGPQSMIKAAKAWGNANKVLVFSEYYGF